MRFVRREDMWAGHREVNVVAGMTASSAPCQATGKYEEVNNLFRKIHDKLVFSQTKSNGIHLEFNKNEKRFR